MTRPKEGTEPISISLECYQVDILDFLCGRRDIKRSQAIRAAIKDWVAKELAKQPG